VPFFGAVKRPPMVMKEGRLKGACALLLLIAALGGVFVLVGLRSSDVSRLELTTDKVGNSTKEAEVKGALSGLGPWPSRERFAKALGGDLSFFLCLVFLSAVLMRCAQVFRRAGGLLLIGALVTAVAHGGNTPGFIISCSVVYGFICLLSWRMNGQRGEHSSRWRWSLFAVASLAAVFLYRSQWPQCFQWEAWGGNWSLVHLDMWLVLRLGMLLWEYGSGRIGCPSPLAFATWCMLPFTLLGPLLRFSDYERQLPWKTTKLPPLDRAWLIDVGQGMGFVLLGLLFGRLYQHWGETGWWGFVMICLTAPLREYFITAGRLGLARQAGALGGFALPVSFDRPFRSSNLAQFWGRWHMTVTSAFRDCLFFSRWGLRVPKLYLNSMVLFLAVGLWHGMYQRCILWGLLQGLGFCTFIAWKQLRGPRLPRPVGCICVYLFMCFCDALPHQVSKFLNQGHLES
jgi:D-alanyl-lipoteichoic acid acyltransferase DltB (MBOAT superfamily)